MNRARFASQACVALCAALASACGQDLSSTVFAPTLVTCSGLAKMPIAAGAIGLPTSGGVVTKAQLVVGSGTGAAATPEHCLVSGKILPVDPAAFPIEFQAALPTVWNSKLMMLGGGAYNGVIPKIAKPSTLIPSPLSRGYAVVGNDSGHQGSPVEGAFALNDEAYRNWVGDSLKKSRDAALVVNNALYGRAPARIYFVGGSTGGREALTVASRWPEDWDGIVSQFPSRDVTAQMMLLVATSRAFAAPGAWLNSPKRKLLHKAALAACDRLDGLVDGVISNVRGCNANFDPATAQLDGAPLRCAGGEDKGAGCLSDAQLNALHRVNGSVPVNFKHVGPEAAVPGYNIFLADPPSLDAVFGDLPPGFPVRPSSFGFITLIFSKLMSVSLLVTDQFVRYVVARDPSFNWMTIDPENLGPLTERLAALSQIEARDSDLSAFAAKGGKVLLLQGAADMLVSPRRTALYVQQMRESLGNEKVDAFLRYYEVPGFGHDQGDFNATWDAVSTLSNWVENGIDPKEPIAIDRSGIPGRTRPLCRYPAWPKYKGTGDANDAASFTCIAE